MLNVYQDVHKNAALFYLYTNKKDWIFVDMLWIIQSFPRLNVFNKRDYKVLDFEVDIYWCRIVTHKAHILSQVDPVEIFFIILPISFSHFPNKSKSK